MDPNSQEYADLQAYVASLTPEILEAMKAQQEMMMKMMEEMMKKE